MTAKVAFFFCLVGTVSAESGYQPGVVVAWGDNNDGQTNVPEGLTDVVAVAARGYHSLALKADGAVAAWGRNNFEQANVPAGLTNVVAIASGNAHSLALKADGTVVAWGYNQYGQTDVPSGLSNVVAIGGGGYFSLALRSNGTVVAWGYNWASQTNVPSGLTNVVAIAGGDAHSLALKADGVVTAWGYNADGQTNVPPDLTNVVAIAGGGFHSLALKSEGTVLAWGKNSSGQTSVPSGLTNVVAIAGGDHHSLALKADGTVVAWGYNYHGQTNVPAGLASVVVITAGGYHNLSITLVPVIWWKPPTTLSLAAGARTNLSVSVWSGSPFISQWSFNGVPIVADTPTNLVFSDFDLMKAGVYAFTISNQYGYVRAESVLRLTNSPIVVVNGVDVGGGVVPRIDSAQIAMGSSFGPDAHLYYTLDGSTPDFTTIPYTGPFTLTNSATVRAIAYNSNFTDSAEAAAITVQVWPTYPLAAFTAGGGSVSVSPSAHSAGNRYVSNTVVTLTATPADGWSFLDWTGDSTSAGNVATVLMDRARSVEAVFGTSLNLFTNGNGHLLLNPSTGLYAFGSSVQLTALPSPVSYFFGWAGAASGFANPLFITATNASGITALFGTLNPNQISFTVLPNGDGTVSVNPIKNVYTNGESVTLTAVSAANHVFTGWSDGASGNLNPLSITLTSTTLITANFVPGSPTNPPVITQPPLSRTLSVGDNTLLFFQLTGDGPFSFQWRLNGSPIPGATNPTLALNGVTPAQAGQYDIVVSGASGSVTSAPASVALFGLELSQSGGQRLPLLILDCAPGTSFRLEHSWSLSPANWSLLAPVTLSGSRLYYVDTPDTNYFRRFYRVVPQ